MKQRRLCFFLVILVLLGIVLCFRKVIDRQLTSVIQIMRGQHTIAGRMREFGPLVRERWKPYFDEACLGYPPSRVIFAAFKKERVLEVWACDESGTFHPLRSYPIRGASGHLGPKLKEGDHQVPEGIYGIESLNPNSIFHLSLRIDYPNTFDKRQARREGRENLGGDIMIHGGSPSIGCLAMGDEAAEDLFVLAAETGIQNVLVILSPVDFRNTEIGNSGYPLPEWTDELYGEIRRELSLFKSQ